MLLTLGGAVDPSVVELRFDDATAVEMDGHGHAIVRTPTGDVVLLRPGVQQETDEGRRALAAGWSDAGQGRVTLAGPTVKEPTAVGFRVLFLPEALAELDRDADGRVTLGELAPPPPAVLGGPVVDATKRDTLVIDNDSDTQADPGDTLSYDVRIDNAPGATSAGSVTFADPLDPNLTLVPGSINVSPLALDDTYQAIGHVTLTVSNPLQGLFANDSEFLADTFALTSPVPNTPTPTAGGGTVTVAADGTFSYTSPAGFAGPSDSFNYTIADAGGLTGSGTVTFTIAGLVWFIDRDAAPGGTGTQASPFDEIADVNGAGGAGDPDAANHILYLHDRAAAVDYVLGLELEPGQQLVGSGVPLVVGATTVLPATTPPTVEHAGGNAITLHSGTTVSGLNVVAANNAAFFGTGALGTTSVSSVAVTTSGVRRGPQPAEPHGLRHLRRHDRRLGLGRRCPRRRRQRRCRPHRPRPSARRPAASCTSATARAGRSRSAASRERRASMRSRWSRTEGERSPRSRPGSTSRPRTRERCSRTTAAPSTSPARRAC